MLLGLRLTISFLMLRKFLTIISSKIFSDPFFFSSSSRTPVIQMLVYLILSQSSLRLSSFLFILFPLFCSSAVISNIVSSSLLIHSSVSVIQQLIPSRVCLISVIVFHLCLFFISSRSLLNVLIVAFSPFYFQDFYHL